MQIPGVAINRSSAITGVEAACSPPPGYEPFRLPATYMHGRDVKSQADPVVTSGKIFGLQANMKAFSTRHFSTTDKAMGV